MRRNLYIFNSKLPTSMRLLVIAFGSFIFMNTGLLILGPYFDSNYGLMKGLNDKSWQDGADFLFLGDSRGHQGLEPRLFTREMEKRGVTADAINLSRPGMQIPFSYYISKRFVEKSNKKPTAVIVNFSFYLLGGMQWMNDIYFSYYRPTFAEAYHSCVASLHSCSDAAIWFVKTRVPAWMFRKRANGLIHTAITNQKNLKAEFRGIFEAHQLMDFDIARGYFNRGYSRISDDPLPPHGYNKALDNGYSIYYRYLNLMLTELDAKGVDVYIYRFPWPESRGNEIDFEMILDHYWANLKAGGNYDNTRVHFIDEILYWDHSLFVDPLHLNHAGTQKLTKFIVDKILENYNKHEIKFSD